MTLRNTVIYICFVSFRCNGTSMIAEVRRTIMNDRPKYLYLFRKCKDDLWVFLFVICMKIFKIPRIKVGSCTDPRYRNHINEKQDTNWNEKVDELLDVLMMFRKFDENKNKMTRAKLDELCKKTLKILIDGKTSTKPQKARFCGAGTFGSPIFLHLSALLGIIPLYCATFGDVGLGSKFFIQKCPTEDKETASVRFRKLHKDLEKVFGHLVTKSLVECTLCELNRSYKNTVKKNKKVFKGKNPPVDIICDSRYMKESPKNDHYYENEIRKCVQNVFLVRLSGHGISNLRPALFMKVSHLSKRTNTWINLTNWCQNGENDKKNIYWDAPPNELKADTKLKMSKEFKKLMKY